MVLAPQLKTTLDEPRCTSSRIGKRQDQLLSFFCSMARTAPSVHGTGIAPFTVQLGVPDGMSSSNCWKLVLRSTTRAKRAVEHSISLQNTGMQHSSIL